MTSSSPTPGVVYLASFYPLLSQQFVRREVEALRRLGVTVRTVAVRPTPAADIKSDADREAATSTDVLLDGRWGALLAAAGKLFVRNPTAFVSTLREALTSGAGGLRSTVWQLFYFAEAVKLVGLLRGTGVRHLHVHFANNAADVARLATTLGTRLEPRTPGSWSLSMHGPTEFMDVTRFDLAAKVRSAAFVACISDFARSQLMTLVEREHWDKLHIVHMGVDVSRFPALADVRRARPAGPLRVLFVGRLVPEKGVPVLMEAVELLTQRGVAVDVTVVGDSPLRSQLQARAAERGLGERLRFVGAVGQDDILGHYEWADVFCLPSFAEGIPVVLMEAMATQLPVVTTTIAGIPELVRDGETGVLVPPGRADRLADALEALASDPSLRDRLGRAGRDAVLAEFEVEAIAPAMAELLRTKSALHAPN